jgi:hypothetical protein
MKCYLPDSGAGEYDLAVLVPELKIKFPQYANQITEIPHDPKTGSQTQTNYRYVISEDGTRCAVYANLEKETEPVTLPNISEPTPGGGKGVFQAASEGWNGTTKFYQVSNSRQDL